MSMIIKTTFGTFQNITKIKQMQISDVYDNQAGNVGWWQGWGSGVPF